MVWSRVSGGYVQSGCCSIVSGLGSDGSGRGLSGEERAHSFFFDENLNGRIHA